MPYIKYTLLILYVLTQGYFLGFMFIWTLPGIPGIHWPYSLIPGYALGLVLSALIAFVIFKKWQTVNTKKIIVAIVLLALVIVVSTTVATWMAEMLRVRAAEVLGLVTHLN